MLTTCAMIIGLATFHVQDNSTYNNHNSLNMVECSVSESTSVVGGEMLSGNSFGYDSVFGGLKTALYRHDYSGFEVGVYYGLTTGYGLRGLLVTGEESGVLPMGAAYARIDAGNSNSFVQVMSFGAAVSFQIGIKF